VRFLERSKHSGAFFNGLVGQRGTATSLADGKKIIEAAGFVFFVAV
jgi:hypothetical protein